MRCSNKQEKLRGAGESLPLAAMGLLSAIIALHIASRADADINFKVRFSGVTDPMNGLRWQLEPVVEPGQLLIPPPAGGVPDPFPMDSQIPAGTPPFVEIFDVAGLDLVEVEPPPPLEAQLRLFGGPSPQSNISDSPNIPNLLLIYTGPNEIVGPDMLGPVELNIPPAIKSLQFFAYAFDTQNSPVINVGTIQVPEPAAAILLTCGGVACSWHMGRHRQSVIRV